MTTPREDHPMYDVHPPGTVALDNPEVEAAMRTVDAMRPSRQRALIRSTYQAVLAFQRTGDVDHLRRFAASLVTTVRLHGIPAVVTAPPSRAHSMGRRCTSPTCSSG
ncbi:hypothetical protein AB0K21_42360 [Streptosporangium sp. NPDC049248]|uniref:hypothetical protein n=1 Tax=Streptosporangium sp. NPDC049248 TaxID=3155651 RepID=UPI00344343A1